MLSALRPKSAFGKALIFSFFAGILTGTLIFTVTLIRDFSQEEMRIERELQKELHHILQLRVLRDRLNLTEQTLRETNQGSRILDVYLEERPYFTSIIVSRMGDTLFEYSNEPAVLDRPVLDLLTPPTKLMVAEIEDQGARIEADIDNHLLYDYFVHRWWENAQIGFARTLLIMLVVGICIHLLLVRPLRAFIQQIQSQTVFETGFIDSGTNHSEFRELASAFNQSLQTRKKLELENRRLLSALMKAPDPCVVYRAEDGVPFFVNDAAIKLLGRDRDFLLKTPIYKLSEYTHRGTYQRTLATAQEEGVVREFRKVRSASGAIVNIEMIVGYTEIDQEGICVLFARPILERAETIRSVQLSALKQVVGGIAHELNNSLQVMQGNLDLAKEALPDQSQSMDFLETVTGKTRELSKLIDRLMSYSKTQHQSVRRFSVSEEVKIFLQAMDYPHSAYRISLAVRTNRDEDLCIMDKSMFDSILLELITNSFDAMDENGWIQIIIDSAKLDSQSRVGAHLLSQGNYVTIKLKDSGHGISEYDLPNVFEPFFTTRNMGRGLGLSSVQSTIDVNDGAIIIESEYGSGTEVTLWLPRVTLPKIVEISDEDNAAAV